MNKNIIHVWPFVAKEAAKIPVFLMPASKFK